MRADRLLSIMLLLKVHNKLTAQKLADRLEVSRRTILRDVEALSIAGVPVCAEGGAGGGIFLDEAYRISLTELNLSELNSLFVAQAAGPLASVGLDKASQTALQKLYTELNTVQQAEIERHRQRLLIDPDGWWQPPGVASFLSLIQTAINQERCLKVRYERGDGALAEYVLEPYSLVAKANVWYLIAASNGKLKLYRLSRFQAVELQDDRFTRQSDFDLADFWREHSQKFMANMPRYPFTIKLNPDRLLFLKWYVYDPYEVLDERDAQGWLTVKFTLGSIDAAKMLLFGLGADARVIEPPALREAVLNSAQAILQAY